MQKDCVVQVSLMKTNGGDALVPDANGEPPPSGCRARRIIGMEAFAECLAQSAANCKYLFAYGYGKYCTHPKREQIICQTTAA